MSPRNVSETYIAKLWTKPTETMIFNLKWKVLKIGRHENCVPGNIFITGFTKGKSAKKILV